MPLSISWEQLVSNDTVAHALCKQWRKVDVDAKTLWGGVSVLRGQGGREGTSEI